MGRFLTTLLPVLTLTIIGLTQAAWGVTPQIAAGNGHTVMLRSDGTIWTNGSNTAGQLGDGTTISRTTPVQVGLIANTTGWVAVAAGDGHTLALKADGSLWAWGANQQGQLGDGSQVNKTWPARIGTANDWTVVAAGGASSFALKRDGTLWAWGGNDLGQLGDGSTSIRTAPVQVGLPLNAVNWAAVAAGGKHTLALKADGTLWAWGSNQYGQIAQSTMDLTAHPVPLRVDTSHDWRVISSGGLHSIALKADGTLWGWGDNQSGQIGQGALTPHTAPVQLGTDRDWTTLSAGDLHTLAAKRNGTLWAWGDNTAGQLGDGTTTDRTTPVRITAPAGITDVVAVAAGTYHSLAFKASGELFAWGDNSSGQLGAGTESASFSPLLVGSDAVSWIGAEPGVEFTVARRSNGTLWSWGNNGSGQLGDTTFIARSAPTMVGIAANWVAEAAGLGHTVALRADGTLWAWGNNWSGQLGDSSTTSRPSPVQVGLPGNAGNWSAVAAGDRHTLALKGDGTLWAWGNNARGQLGDGSVISKNAPVKIMPTKYPGNFDRRWVAIAAGGSHSLALQADGTLWAWGDNSFGQLGNPVLVAGSNTPRQVVKLIPPQANPGWNSSWLAIAAGLGHSLALQADGTLWAWGNNAAGQLGDGTTINRQVPTQIPATQPVSAANGWTTIAAGDTYSMARQVDGTLWTWGNDSRGQLGNGSSDPDPLHPTSHPTPVREKSNATDWVTAGGGGSHAIALKASGNLWAWGDNGKGQLGSGNTIARNIPAPLVETSITVTSLLSFNVQSIGTSSMQPVTIKNDGTAPLTVSSVIRGGAEQAMFSVTAGSCNAAPPFTPFTVSAGGSCTLNVTFNPSSAGAKNATLTIASNDPLTPEVTVNIAGTAVAPVTVTASVTAGSPAGSGTITPSGAVQVVPGTSQSFAITPASGFHITDVTVNGVSKGTPYTVILPVGNTGGTVTASFAVNTYTVTATAGPNGAISGPTEAKHGELKTYTITANPGYHVADVKVDDKSVGAVTTLTLPVIANSVVTVTFALNNYIVTRNAGYNGAISGPATAEHGTTPTYAITPNPGYHISDVKVNGVSKGAATTVMLPSITADTTIAATFSNTYTVTTENDSKGWVWPSGKVTVTSGAKFTFTPLGSYQVVDVYIDGVAQGPLSSYTFTGIPGDGHTLKVLFIPDGDVNGDGKVDIGDALIALRISVGLVPPTATNALHGDTAPLDASGIPLPDKQISVADSLMILRKVIGLSSGW